MSRKPLISVVTAVYNGASYIEETIRGVLNQTEGDFEYLIVDDASVDGTVDLIASFHDERIHLIRNEQNQRVVGARNRGLDLCQGEFVALTDCDDLSDPNRFALQLKAMRSDPELQLVGANAQNINADGQPLVARAGRDERPELTRARLFFRNQFVHSSIFFRRSGVEDLRYRTEFQYSEDYDLIVRCAGLGRIRILPEILVSYRIHGDNLSVLNYSEMVRLSGQIKSDQLKEIGLEASAEELSLHRSFEHPNGPMDRVAMHRLAAWCEKMLGAVQYSKYPCADAFEAVLYEELISLIERQVNFGNSGFDIWNEKIYRQAMKSDLLAYLRILLKRIIY
ncbi:MAG: glycosyltransferase [Paucibacter sp.]|nr:glycosyltransferase [Roseateles sp.]